MPGLKVTISELGLFEDGLNPTSSIGMLNRSRTSTFQATPLCTPPPS